MFGASPPRAAASNSDTEKSKSKKKTKKRKKDEKTSSKSHEIPENEIVGDYYKPRDLSVNVERDIDLPLDQIRKVLWEDYDSSTLYGQNFVIPVRGYSEN